MADTKDLVIQQGKTYPLTLRWENADQIVSKQITGVSFATGVPVLTVPSHGMVDGWRSYVMGVLGPKQLNAQNNPPVPREKEAQSDWHPSTIIDADTVKYAGVMPYDDQGRIWTAYVSGGALYYNTPVDLTGYTARMAIKDKVGGTVLHNLTTENGGITINTSTNTIVLSISATDTAAFDWKRGVYDLEMVSSSGVVTALLTGMVTVTKEVTT